MTLIIVDMRRRHIFDFGALYLVCGLGSSGDFPPSLSKGNTLKLPKRPNYW